MPSFITVLIAPTRQQATKTAWLTPTGWVIKPIRFAKQFQPVEYEVESLDEVGAMIDTIRETNTRAVLIAGRMSAAVRAKLVVQPGLTIMRRGVAGHTLDGTGTIEDVPRQHVCIDVDKYRLPNGH